MTPFYTEDLKKQINIEVVSKKDGRISRLALDVGTSLMETLIKNGYYIRAVCGGSGRCGKCKVKVLKGMASITAEDENFFDKSELNAGFRLSCMLYPTEDLTIELEITDDTEFSAVSRYDGMHYEDDEGFDSEYDIAIDIGTTTLAFALVGKTSGNIHRTVTKVNSQRKFGADVIARINVSVDGHKSELRECILKDLQDGVAKLIDKAGIKLSEVIRIIIAGNTTMGHLLMGYDCESLGTYPFAPVNIDFITASAKNVLGIECDAECMLLPGISTYVGGDIVSGIYACGIDKLDDICLLVDLGTNGEMAIGNADKILVTSTAAGPAFEGGNIECGVGSVAGAICAVDLSNNNVNVRTIFDKKPVGICGTGVVEAVAELLREDILDDTGLLAEEYFDDGFELAKTSDGRDIVLTQKDIRELQLAKSAIRAGIETLLIRYGVKKSQVSKVYIAGGFGYKLDIKKAIAIGMIPKEFAKKTVAVGNSSLAGAVKYLHEKKSRNSLDRIVNISEEISLSMDKDFNEFYMEHMMFEK